ncbi:EAL domain-containing protein [Microbacterium sp. QXD-8]|uniref:EAL domain-containing protein n=1 Tax=Microbacterium psychrotolerans TaxID=3068321 RepID=A0ABU0Z1Q9_9MICO|nr:EAL domain-containing protein [Microbacterium sp. QXD-8]MDQ7878511.1 EAL domain-containing protein [Microbacterium sp. QXD-8]
MPTTDDLADDLATAVRGADVFAVYQPQVSLESGSIVAAEALCRWRHPRLGDIDPATMIGVAERSGAIHALGRRMLDDCLDTLAGWRETGRDWAVAVNVSPMQFSDESFAHHVAAELGRREFAPGALVLELTQDSHPVDERVVLPQLRMLREVGAEISLAGYGASSSSLDHLRSAPLTEVKLPGELVRSAAGPALDALRDSVQVAHAHGLRVVAEGIETLSHLDIAVQLGCDRAQGFLIRHPDSEIVFP